jgi:hypothetical protein
MNVDRLRKDRAIIARAAAGCARGIVDCSRFTQL